MASINDASQPFAVRVEDQRNGAHSVKYFPTAEARSKWVEKNEERFTTVAWSDPRD